MTDEKKQRGGWFRRKGRETAPTATSPETAQTGNSGKLTQTMSAWVRALQERRDTANRIRALAANDPKRYGVAADRTYAIPNGGGRSRAEAGRLKAEGVRKGVSDVFVSFPAHGKHGMYIEMKAPTGRVSDEQNKWIYDSQVLRYHAAVCFSADDAVNIWRAYVDGTAAT